MALNQQYSLIDKIAGNWMFSVEHGSKSLFLFNREGLVDIWYMG
jgi:hypothetical protein